MAGYRGEGYGIYGDHGDDDFYEDIRRERDEDRYSNEDRFRSERSYRGRDEDRPMFGRWGERGEQRWRDRERENQGDRGFFERARDEVRSWGSDRDDDDDRWGSQDRQNWRTADRYRQQYGMQGHEGQYGQRGSSSRDMSPGRSRMYGSSQDQHYHSWRDRQMQELDRDYQDYCREREQQFHQDFNQWRSSRSPSSQQRGGMSGSQGSQGMGGTVSSSRDMSGAAAGGSGTLTLDTPASGSSSETGSSSGTSEASSRGSSARGRSNS